MSGLDGVLLSSSWFTSPVTNANRRTRLVKKLMRHSCSTSITRRGALDSVLGVGVFAGPLFRREQEDVTFPLVVSLAVKMINEVGERPSQ